MIAGPTYVTRDNGGRPFEVYLPAAAAPEAFISNCETKELLLRVPYRERWVGLHEFGRETPYGLGNSLLFHLEERKFLYVGECVYEFSLDDGEQVTKFVSNLENNDVVYSYCITNNDRILFLSTVSGYFNPERNMDKVRDLSWVPLQHFHFDGDQNPPPDNDFFQQFYKLQARHERGEQEKVDREMKVLVIQPQSASMNANLMAEWRKLQPLS